MSSKMQELMQYSVNTLGVALPLCPVHGIPHKPGTDRAAGCARAAEALDCAAAASRFSDRVNQIGGPPVEQNYRWMKDAGHAQPICPVCLDTVHLGWNHATRHTGDYMLWRSGPEETCQAAASFMTKDQREFGTRLRDLRIAYFLNDNRIAPVRRTMWIREGIDREKMELNYAEIIDEYATASNNLAESEPHWFVWTPAPGPHADVGPGIHDGWSVMTRIRNKALRNHARWHNYVAAPIWWEEQTDDE